MELARFFGSTAQRLALLRAGDLDVAFVRLAHLDDRQLAFRQLLVEPMHVALPAQHPLAGQAVVALPQLDGQQLAFYAREQNPQWYDEVLGQLRGVGVRPGRLREGWSVMDALPLVAGDGAVAFISTTMTRLMHYPGVVYRPLSPAPTLGLGMAWDPATTGAPLASSPRPEQAADRWPLVALAPIGRPGPSTEAGRV